MLKTFAKTGSESRKVLGGLLSVVALSIVSVSIVPNMAMAENSRSFQARFNEDVFVERLYEEKEISLTITEAHDGGQFLEKAAVKGYATIDAVTGRMVVELTEVVQAGMPMEVVGYVLDEDGEQGVSSCAEWQTRMFEDSKLCYAAEIFEDREVKIVVSTMADFPVTASQGGGTESATAAVGKAIPSQ